MKALHFRKLYQSLVPVDQESVDAMESIKANDEVFVRIKGITKSQYRRICQNKLYWSWIHDCVNTGINECAGKTTDEWHYQFKKDYLVRIYERDDLGYAAMMDTLRGIYRQGLKSECEVMREHVIKETSTTTCSVAQFSEFLNDIQRYCHSKGVLLRTDNNEYKTAMGIK